MYAMPHGDDLDERFNELVAQIDAEEQRRMRTSAAKGAKESRRTAARPRRDRSSPRDRDRLSPYDHQPRRRIGRAWLAMATITAVIAAAGLVVTFRPDLLAPSGIEDFSRGYTDYNPAGGPIPEETMPVEAPAPEEPEEAAEEETAAGPFEGSPAEDWAEGVDGFVMPKAKALGGLSKKQVAEGLKRTRALLAAAHLDRKTLLGGKPGAFAKLLDRDQRDWFRKELDDAKHPARRLVNSFAPKTAELVTDVIKVKGRATLGTFKEDGLRGVEVRLNHLIAYAVHRPGQPHTTIRVVTHATGRALLYRVSGRLVIWASWGASATPARCDVEDGYIHPFYDDSPSDKATPSGPPTDPYDLEDAPDADDGCRAAQPT